MNRRERFLQTMTFAAPDRPASGDYFYYEATRQRWEREGLPPGIDLTEYFGMDFDPFKWQVPANVVGPLPDFGTRILDEDEHVRTLQNPDGGIVKILKNEPPPAMPQWVRYPLASRAEPTATCGIGGAWKKSRSFFSMTRFSSRKCWTT
jgi:hypothetical protein